MGVIYLSEREIVMSKLIKNKVTTVKSDEPQEANAINIANQRNKVNNSGGRLYIVLAEDPIWKDGIAAYVALKLVEDSSLLCNIIGFELTKPFDYFKTYEDAEEYQKKENIEIINVRIPWTKVINIKNVSYQYKK